jgi:hypothetical protein
MGTSLKNINKQKRIKKIKENISQLSINNKNKFSLLIENQNKNQKDLSQNNKKKNTRLDFEESFPLYFTISGDFKFMNPLKMNFKDPRFIVFIQKLKRIVLPSLGNRDYLHF